MHLGRKHRKDEQAWMQGDRAGAAEDESKPQAIRSAAERQRGDPRMACTNGDRAGQRDVQTTRRDLGMRERALPQSGAAAPARARHEKSVSSRADARDHKQHAARLGAGVSRKRSPTPIEFSIAPNGGLRSINAQSSEGSAAASDKPTIPFQQRKRDCLTASQDDKSSAHAYFFTASGFVATRQPIGTSAAWRDTSSNPARPRRR